MRHYVLAAAGLLWSCIVVAEIPVDATLSLRSDAWSGDRNLNANGTLAGASAWGQAKVDMDSMGQWVGSGWGRMQSRDLPSHGLVREFYWRNDIGPLNVKLGRQMIAWGRADGLNPTDNLSPRDFTLLVTEDSDMRHGNEAANFSLDTNAGLWSAIWFPNAASHTIPLQAISNVIYRVESPPESSQWAVKWDGRGENIDGSLSYFDGYDPTPDLFPGGLSMQGLEVVVRNQRAQVLGGDVSWIHNGTIWRAEAAWLDTNSAGRLDFTHKKPQLWLVGGGEWQFGDGGTLGLQTTVRHVFDYASPDELAPGPEQEVAWRQAATSDQVARNQGGFTWRIAQRWWNDTLTLETTGVVVWPSTSGIIRAKVDYAMTDHLRLLVGAEDYFGPMHSFFGQLQNNQLTYVQLRYGL